VVVWGSGSPRREFLYSDDMADACLKLMSLPDVDFAKLTAAYPPLINVGAGEDMTVRELAETVARVVEFEGALRFDRSRPDGTPRKLLDVSRLSALGWRPQMAIEDGIRLAYRAYRESSSAPAPQTQ
jgi:GDP-L-fucose synthase